MTIKIILGPTAVGKSDFAIEEALRYNSPVISCDSRQIYKEMNIGTAVPSQEQLSLVKHYFIQDHSIHDVYTAGKYEIEALELVEKLFNDGHDTLIMCGGSGFYIDAFCNGLDDFPKADQELRAKLTSQWREEGVESLASRLKELDPESYNAIDISNGQRIVRALEVCLMTGKKFSSFKTSSQKKRKFKIEKIGLTRDRDELYNRINLRVHKMITEGLVEEARSLESYRHLPALQTVGYKEIFDWFDYQNGLVNFDNWGPTSPGDGPVHSIERAIELIQRNTRHYAKRQMTYWGRDKEIKWVYTKNQTCDI